MEALYAIELPDARECILQIVIFSARGKSPGQQEKKL